MTDLVLYDHSQDDYEDLTECQMLVYWPEENILRRYNYSALDIVKERSEVRTVSFGEGVDEYLIRVHFRGREQLQMDEYLNKIFGQASFYVQPYQADFINGFYKKNWR